MQLPAQEQPEASKNSLSSGQDHTEAQFREQVAKYLIEKYNLQKPNAETLANALMQHSNEFNRGMKWEQAKEAIKSISQASGKYARSAQYVLSNEKTANLFAEHTEEFVKIAQAAGENAWRAFESLSNEKTAGLFAGHTEEFVKIAQAAGMRAYSAFNALSEYKIADLFTQNPGAFVKIAQAAGKLADYAFSNLYKITGLFATHVEELVKLAQATGENAGHAFNAISNEKITGIFAGNPQFVIDTFVKISQTIGNSSWNALDALQKEDTAEIFASYAEGKATFSNLMFAITVQSSIEIGRLLDDLHDQDAERKKSLASLSTETVLALLCSNPEYFYTSSNHLLFDRLRQDLNSRNVSGLMQEFGGFQFDSGLGRNFLFRAINYDRMYGRENSLLTKEEAQTAADAILAPLSQKTFNHTYFFLLANAIAGLPGAVKREKIAKKISSALISSMVEVPWASVAQRSNAAMLRRACEYLLAQIEPQNDLISKKDRAEILRLNELTIYKPKNYIGKDGYTTCIQVFDRGDTQKDHWGLSENWGLWNSLGWKKEILEDGKQILFTNQKEKKRAILYMGESAKENQTFARNSMQKYGNGIITFRGHSGSLMENFPSDVFGNNGGNWLFIPGSCGSAGSTADYIMENPSTNISFVSNTSTGRGQVTNALVGIFLGIGKEIEFDKVKQLNSEAISRQGGDVSTLTFSSIGEMLLRYVFKGSI